MQSDWTNTHDHANGCFTVVETLQTCWFTVLDLYSNGNRQHDKALQVNSYRWYSTHHSCFNKDNYKCKVPQEVQVFDSIYHTTLTLRFTFNFLRNHLDWYSFAFVFRLNLSHWAVNRNFSLSHNDDFFSFFSHFVVPVFRSSVEVSVNLVNAVDLVVVEASFFVINICSDIVFFFISSTRFSTCLSYSFALLDVFYVDYYLLFHAFLL